MFQTKRKEREGFKRICSDSFDGMFLKLTFIAVERHPAGMEEAFPALALVLVQHESVAEDGGALEGGNKGEPSWCLSKSRQASANVSQAARRSVAFVFPLLTSDVIRCRLMNLF